MNALPENLAAMLVDEIVRLAASLGESHELTVKARAHLVRLLAGKIDEPATSTVPVGTPDPRD